MIKKYYKKISCSEKGYSILEVIISLGIITLGLVGVLSLVIQNVRAQYVDKNNIIASMLAQEGLELVRNIRDSNRLSSLAWKDGVSDGNGTTKIFKVDYTGKSSISDITGILNGRLYVNASGFYSNGSTGTATPFYRMITVIDNTDYLEVRCLVRHANGANVTDYEARTLLYNWLPSAP